MFTRRQAQGLRAAALWLATGVLLATPALAQDTTRVTATMLRRIAEAVAGQTVDSTVWVVVDYAFPHRVSAVVAERADAVRIVGPRSAEAGIFGPFRAGPLAGGWLPPDCWHNGLSMYRPRICPELIMPMPPQGPDSITITMHLNGRVVTRVLPRGVDAVFFSLPALDKFFFPYYADVLGVAEAARMRQDLADRIPR